MTLEAIDGTPALDIKAARSTSGGDDSADRIA